MRPSLIGARSLAQQIELVVEHAADVEAAHDIVDEWLDRFGYVGAAARAGLERSAAQAGVMARWHVCIVRALVLQPRCLLLHCAADAPERPQIDALADTLRTRYPLRQARVVDEP